MGRLYDVSVWPATVKVSQAKNITFFVKSLSIVLSLQGDSSSASSQYNLHFCSSLFHQMLHFFFGFIGDPLGQLNALANSFEFDRVPLTLGIEIFALEMLESIEQVELS